MSVRSPLKKIIFICVLFFMSLGNFTCNSDKNSDEDHFCLIQKPVGGEIWFKRSVNKIMWFDNQSEFVRIDLSCKDLPVMTIAESVINTGVYQWEVPADLIADSNYKIEIISLNDESIVDQSIESFTLHEPFPTKVLVDQRDGQSYKTLKISHRWWMAENLNYTTQSGSMSYMDDPVYAETFGRLYLWNAAMIACPEGWQIPSDDEWKQLELELGLTEEQVDQTGLRGNDVGDQMKEGGGSGFDALYGGYYRGFMPPYRFGHVHNDTRFWTSTKDQDQETHVWRRFLMVGDDGIDRNITWTTNGNSVRCIKTNHINN